MLEAPLTGCEADRLDALRDYDILDTPPEQPFDDLTWLASHWCGTPIALVSLVDADRQWFKSRVGLDAPETPRKVAFCSHAILHPDEVMVISDARLDPRFADNPIVTGEPHVIFYAGAPLITPEGMPLGTLCVIDHEPRELADGARESLAALARQVVSQLELRRNVKRLSKAREELARANHDLTEFTSVAAHDLQEPLRKLTSFSQLLEIDLGDDLPPAAAEDLKYIRSAAERMDRLINALLRLSGIGTRDEEIEILDLDVCLDAALEDLSVRIKETEADIEREPLPSVRGSSTLYTQVFQNLVGNALKFCDGEAPRIRIHSSEQAGETVVTISDNGIGIPPERAEEIFAPFRRLHARQEFAGTGIGLAIVRKAVERLGGRAWAAARPEKGSDFSFTVAATEEKTVPTSVS